MFNRRFFLVSGGLGLLLSLFSKKSEAKLTPTPRQTEGPFYPRQTQNDIDLDLTQISGKKGRAKGKEIVVKGVVLSEEGTPLAGSTIDLWQANAAGKYLHPFDDNPAPVDPNFQGWAIVKTDMNGAFWFKSVFPGSYSLGRTSRPPHIHFKVKKKGYKSVTTQMYFPGEKLNQKDFILNRLSFKERNLLIASEIADEDNTYRFNFVLKKA